MDQLVKTDIEGVVIKHLKTFHDDRGKLFTMVKSTEAPFEKFSEIYFSFINPEVVKGWKRHKKMTQLFACPLGELKLVIFDDREDSSSKGKTLEINFGENDYKLIKIPPKVLYAIKCSSNVQAMLANCTDMIHDDQEVEEYPIDTPEIPYSW